MNLTITLPWPPTANTYWRRNGARYFISKRGLEYRNFVMHSCLIYEGLFPEFARINISIKAYPPDKRKRDLDNLFKSLLDSLQHAGLYVDDSQIDKLCIERMSINLGKLEVTLERID